MVKRWITLVKIIQLVDSCAYFTKSKIYVCLSCDRNLKSLWRSTRKRSSDDVSFGKRKMNNIQKYQTSYLKYSRCDCYIRENVCINVHSAVLFASKSLELSKKNSVPTRNPSIRQFYRGFVDLHDEWLRMNIVTKYDCLEWFSKRDVRLVIFSDALLKLWKWFKIWTWMNRHRFVTQRYNRNGQVWSGQFK